MGGGGKVSYGMMALHCLSLWTMWVRKPQGIAKWLPHVSVFCHRLCGKLGETCGATCVITVSWESYHQAHVLLCVLSRILGGHPVGTSSSVLTWFPVGDTCGEWCVLEILELQNLLRKLLFFLGWVIPVPAYLCKSVPSRRRSSVLTENLSLP